MISAKTLGLHSLTTSKEKQEALIEAELHHEASECGIL